MNSPIIINEILGRSEQGMTRPFICRAGFYGTYFVKGAYAGKRSLCCEWVAHRLAHLALPNAPLGLPIFKMAEVPVELIKGSGRADIIELGEGLVFASHRIDRAQELTWSSAQGWPEDTMALLLLIDLWVQNEDRSLSALGGNPNLLVEQIPSLPKDDPEGALWADQPRRETLWVFDFNLAFDENFSRQRFFDAHVFGNMLKIWPEGFRDRMEPQLIKAISEVRAIFDELPLEWLYVDSDNSLPVQLDVERVVSVLEMPFTDPAHVKYSTTHEVVSVLEMPFTDPDSFWKLP